MNTARAWLGAFLVQWRVGIRGWEHLGAVLMSVPYAVVLAWVAGESGNPPSWPTSSWVRRWHWSGSTLPFTRPSQSMRT